MSKLALRLIGLIALSLLALPAVSAAPAQSIPTQALTGNWAGDGFALRSAPTGLIAQGRCASGKISGPVFLDRTGAFTAIGYFNPYTSGLSLSDIAPTDQTARFVGRLVGNNMQLQVHVAGLPETNHVLKRNASIKFGKCQSGQ